MSEQGSVSAPATASERPESGLGSLLGAGVLAAGLYLSPRLAPALFPLALVSPLPLAVLRLRTGGGGTVLATVLAAALIAAVLTPGPAAWYLVVLAAPALLMAESLARGRGLLRGCGWAFALLVAETAVGLLLAGASLAERMLAPLEHLRSEAFLNELKAGAVPPERLAAWTEQVGTLYDALAVVFPAAYVIGGALLVLANAALLRLYLVRRDPGWLEDGEFERVRWSLGLVGVFVVSGAAVALEAARPVAYNVLLVVAFFFALQGLAVVGFYARRLAGPPLLRVAVVVLVLANPWAPQILALLGLSDNWFDFRRWAEPSESGDGTRPGGQS
jgi:uncharacterized protein YybS (DUF2232 family)